MTNSNKLLSTSNPYQFFSMENQNSGYYKKQLVEKKFQNNKDLSEDLQQGLCYENIIETKKQSEKKRRIRTAANSNKSDHNQIGTYSDLKMKLENRTRQISNFD